jgi:alanyl-tRNA synthetase
MLSAQEIIKRYIAFFEKRGHKRTPNAPLVPINDPTTLYVGSGMQALIPYLLGEPHPSGKRLINAQNCFRSQDIEEIGDNRHTTFFRMLGNWSLGDYFKKEQLAWLFTFLTDVNEGLGLDPNRLFVTIFAGNESVPKDIESIEIWKELFKTVGINAKEDKRILTYGVEKNWWSRSGIPERMPAGEPGGPDSEVFYDFGDEEIHQNSPWKDKKCHVNCDCGRYIEIANSVFMQYQKQEDGSFKELPQKNVDFGGGLERFLQAVDHQPDVFKTSLFYPIVESIHQHLIEHNYNDDHRITKAYRLITDHLVASSFIIANGVEPSNKDRGYLLRRLIRRAATQNYLWGNKESLSLIVDAVIEQYHETDPKLIEAKQQIKDALIEEESKFYRALDKGIKEWSRWVETKHTQTLISGKSILGSSDRLPPLPAEKLFDLYQSYGLPLEVMKEITKGNLDEDGFKEMVKKHQNSSRTASAGMFKGGLADTSEQTVMGHTATHLVHQALRDVFGKQLHQTGSNITSDRIRFDFNHNERLTDEELIKVEQIVNSKIKENLPVYFELIPTKKAHEMGAIGLFMDTYGENSKIYFVGPAKNTKGKPYSIEFCGGPHVDFTGVLKSFKIIKQENLGKNQKRIYAVVGQQ